MDDTNATPILAIADAGLAAETRMTGDGAAVSPPGFATEEPSPSKTTGSRIRGGN
jgi:hypothetical protein